MAGGSSQEEERRLWMDGWMNTKMRMKTNGKTVKE
jgi:hypothetical protein